MRPVREDFLVLVCPEQRSFVIQVGKREPYLTPSWGLLLRFSALKYRV
jgi:hypothetical protein